MSLFSLLPYALLCQIIGSIDSASGVRALKVTCLYMRSTCLDPFIASVFLVATYRAGRQIRYNTFLNPYGMLVAFSFCKGGIAAVILELFQLFRNDPSSFNADVLLFAIRWISDHRDVVILEALMALPVSMLQIDINRVLQLCVGFPYGPALVGLAAVLLRGLKPSFDPVTKYGSPFFPATGPAQFGLGVGIVPQPTWSAGEPFPIIEPTGLELFGFTAQTAGLLPTLVLLFQYCPILKLPHAAEVAMLAAAGCGNMGAVLFLLSCPYMGLKVVQYCVEVAGTNGHSDVLITILSHPGVTLTGDGSRVVLRIVERNHLECLRILLEFGGNANYGWDFPKRFRWPVYETALWRTVLEGRKWPGQVKPYTDEDRIIMATLLLQHGAKVAPRMLTATQRPVLLALLLEHSKQDE